MASIIKNIKRKCNKCNTHTQMIVSNVKNKKPSSLAKINRRKNEKYVGRGPSGKFGKTPAKSSKTCKKANLLITCVICSAKRNLVRGRVGKLTIK